MPYRLVYSSEAAPDLKPAELEGMLAESRIRNKAHGISGVLVFVDGAFLQVLEGEKNDVLDLMGRIDRDPRHRGVKVFYEQEVDERAFTSWSMAYLSPSAEVAKWAELEGATIGDILASVEAHPGAAARDGRQHPEGAREELDRRGATAVDHVRTVDLARLGVPACRMTSCSSRRRMSSTASTPS